MKYYYFYKITNNINHKYYYGVHSTNNLEDGYMGSGKLLKFAYEKYGISNFTKQILNYFNNKQEMYAYERQIVTQDLVKDPMCYNIAIGGNGGLGKGIYFTDEHRKNISESLKGKPKSDIHRKHLSESTIGRTPWNKGKVGLNYPWKDGTLERYREYWKNHPRDPQQYQKSWETRRKNGTTNTRQGHKNSEYQKNVLRNMKWMCNENSVIRVNINDVDMYKDMGYTLGRKYIKSQL